MFRYELIRNHYVIEIEGKRYFIDSGSPFSVSEDGASVLIDGKRYATRSIPKTYIQNAQKLIGVPVNGWIGMDVLNKTSLTIYKDGKVEFACQAIDGQQCTILSPSNYPIIVPAVLANGKEAAVIVDTGASYYYGDYSNCFSEGIPVGRYDDYNPNLGWFSSEFYTQKIQIAKKTLEIQLGNSKIVSALMKGYSNVVAFINVTELFDEVVVLDFKHHKLIFR